MDQDEKEMREALSQKLGVEFCSEEDLEREYQIAKAQRQNPPKIAVGEIIVRCNEARKKMSVKNPNNYLLYLCATALNQLVDRLAQYEKVN